MHRKIFRVLFCVIVIACFTLLLKRYFPYSIENDLDKTYLVNNLLTLLIPLTTLVGIYQYKSKLFNYSALAWIIIFFLMLVIYNYKSDLINNRIIGSLFPMKPVELNDNTLTYRSGNDGHFYAEILMNNHKMLCLIDTGASSILIDKISAESIGIEASNLDFNIITNTANGYSYVASSTVSELKIGSWIFNNIHVKVSSYNHNQCLMGMSFLNLLTKFYIENDSLTLIR